MKREQSRIKRVAESLIDRFLAAGFTMPATAQKAIELSDEQDLVKGAFAHRKGNMTKLGFALFAVVIMTWTRVAYAEGESPDIEGAIQEEPRAEKTRWVSFAIGVADVPDYEGSEDFDTVLVSIVRVDWRRRRYIEFSGTRLRANLISGSMKWQAGSILNYNPGRDDVENDRVDALRNIDDTFEGGGFVTYDSGRWETYLEFLTDLDDEHDGSLTTFRETYTA